MNPIEQSMRHRNTSSGPENIDKHPDQTIGRFLAMPSGWLIYNTDGLDGKALLKFGKNNLL
jgi:hypothetical protein